ncbi:hypothetical protein K227x_02080 [Rubripirellula lacrimiformis]|uniref:Uncharacterized protein n=1 Tax=Rubripirellula lacrimiformis TaxID=1930273 RepID=A0A517N3W8_9BACT|nr:phage holin family protein [Rubripirellula lacrimiformis]QDT01839.1 hypothetical protein K227x_02080 [Rubripirellula lacrimiformis]
MTRNNSIQRVARDVIDLCELQMQLLAVDSQEARRKVTSAAILAAVAVLVGGSAITVLMIGSGLLLAEMTDLSAGGAMMVVTLLALSLTALFLVFANKALRAATAALGETKSEFSANLKWLKATLVSPDELPPTPGRSGQQARYENPDQPIYPPSARQSDDFYSSNMSARR